MANLGDKARHITITCAECRRFALAFYNHALVAQNEAATLGYDPIFTTEDALAFQVIVSRLETHMRNVLGEGGETTIGTPLYPDLYPIPSVTITGPGAIVSGIPTFTWTGNGTGYQIQIALASSPLDILIDETETATSYTPASAPANHYVWRVRAYSTYPGYTVWSEWSELQSLEVTA